MTKYEDNLEDNINKIFLNNKDLHLGEFEMDTFRIIKK